MKTDRTKKGDDVEIFPAQLPLDPETIAWLARLHRATGTHPNEIIASMLRDIREDDAQYDDVPPARGTRH